MWLPLVITAGVLGALISMRTPAEANSFPRGAREASRATVVYARLARHGNHPPPTPVSVGWEVAPEYARPSSASGGSSDMILVWESPDRSYGVVKWRSLSNDPNHPLDGEYIIARAV